MNDSIKIKAYPLREKYGAEYYNLLKHKIRLYNRYKIHYPIDNKKYNMKTYNKRPNNTFK